MSQLALIAIDLVGYSICWRVILRRLISVTFPQKHEALRESKREKIHDRKGGLLKGRPPELGYLSRISEGRQQGYRIPRWQKFEGWRWEQTK